MLGLFFSHRTILIQKSGQMKKIWIVAPSFICHCLCCLGLWVAGAHPCCLEARSGTTLDWSLVNLRANTWALIFQTCVQPKNVCILISMQESVFIICTGREYTPIPCRVFVHVCKLHVRGECSVLRKISQCSEFSDTLREVHRYIFRYLD